jgi:hypothetical protein
MMIAILQHTPLWVLAVFAVLLWLGLQALRPRVVSTWRVFLTPAVFIAWGLVTLALRATAAPPLLLDWLLAAAAGASLALMTVRMSGLGIDRDRGLVRLPASPLPLIRNLSIFAAKYVIAATSARHPEWSAALAPWDVAVSGLALGYFLGWSARFWLAQRHAAGADLGGAQGGRA